MNGDSRGFPRLLADVGGTTVRFGSQFEADGKISHISRYPCAEFETLQEVICHHLVCERLGPPRICAVGIATPVTADNVRMTNHHWAFSIQALKEALQLERLLVLNDFSALALSLPVLKADALHQVGGGSAVFGAPMGLVGPGTGLGVAALVPIPGGEGFIPVSGEGGHVTLGSCDPEEAAVLKILQLEFGHVSAERAVSGPGLENLYNALAQVHGTVVPDRRAADITRGAIENADPICHSALTLFCSFLGHVAGNVALTLGARGGLYIGGGIVPQLGAWFDRSGFRESFEAKGRLAGYLRQIPTLVLNDNAEAALLGASRALDMQATSSATHR
jgi:glucokinase